MAKKKNSSAPKKELPAWLKAVKGFFRFFGFRRCPSVFWLNN